ncbi:hypothetical protein HAX54_036469 [Datura stramonium]|uniref:Uncharacterized protein n=1 Tax=Datura stramonium TaxID=4076 RepID=A0ABS8VIK9_DATST|nr:hypothetical protein [Datura stramonium]
MAVCWRWGEEVEDEGEKKRGERGNRERKSHRFFMAWTLGDRLFGEKKTRRDLVVLLVGFFAGRRGGEAESVGEEDGIWLLFSRWLVIGQSRVVKGERRTGGPEASEKASGRADR